MTQENICIIGAGNIGTAMARGLARAGHRVSLWNRSKDRLALFPEPELLTHLTTSLPEAMQDATMAVICVEGHAVLDMVAKVAPMLPKDGVLVSCAASVSMNQLFEACGECFGNIEVARVLPNVAATQGASANLVCSSVADSKLCEIFSATGPCFELGEIYFPAAMALTSCGIANIFRYVRAATEGAVELGLDPRTSKKLLAATLLGAAEILINDPRHPEELIDSVTTPGGLTIKGLNEMERMGFSAAVIAGVKAAVKHPQA